MLQTYAVCRKEYVHLTAAFTLGSDVLQGHADMKGTECCNERRAIGYCYFSGDKTKFRDTGFAAVFAVSVSIVKRCQKMLFVDRKMSIWSLAFHWEALCCKVMLIWREHSAAMSAVPLGTATSAVIKWSSGFAAVFAISVSIVKCCQKMLFVDRKMSIWSLAFHWEALCCKVMPG